MSSLPSSPASARATLLAALLVACTPACAVLDGLIPAAEDDDTSDMMGGMPDMVALPDMGRDLGTPDGDMVIAEPDMPPSSCADLKCAHGCLTINNVSACQTRFDARDDVALPPVQDGLDADTLHTIQGDDLIMASVTQSGSTLTFNALIQALNTPEAPPEQLTNLAFDTQLTTLEAVTLKEVGITSVGENRTLHAALLVKLDDNTLSWRIVSIPLSDPPTALLRTTNYMLPTSDIIPADAITVDGEDAAGVAFFDTASNGRFMFGGRLCYTDPGTMLPTCVLGLLITPLGAGSTSGALADFKATNTGVSTLTGQVSGGTVALAGFDTSAPATELSLSARYASLGGQDGLENPDVRAISVDRDGTATNNPAIPRCNNSSPYKASDTPRQLQLLDARPISNTPSFAALTSLVASNGDRRGVALFSHGGTSPQFRVRCVELVQYESTTLLASRAGSSTFNYSQGIYTALLKGKRAGETAPHALLLDVTNALAHETETTRLSFSTSADAPLDIIDALRHEDGFLVLAAPADRSARGQLYTFSISATGQLRN